MITFHNQGFNSSKMTSNLEVATLPHMEPDVRGGAGLDHFPFRGTWFLAGSMLSGGRASGKNNNIIQSSVLFISKAKVGV